MGCLKLAYHIRRASNEIVENATPVRMACQISADVMDASEWETELVAMLMSHCPDDAVKWAKGVMKGTKESIDQVAWAMMGE